MATETTLTTVVKGGLYDVIKHGAPLPDATDPKYIKHSAQVIGMERFNGLMRPVRRVTISGVHLRFDAADRRGVLREYNGKEDIKELYIVADRVEVARALRFPQTRIVIICRSLEFTGAEASLDTSPSPTSDYRELLDRNGQDGAKAGDISLYVARLQSGPAATPRFVARGGAGQSAEEGDIEQARNRKDVRLITKEEWDAAFSYSNRRVIHEEASENGMVLYWGELKPEQCDWQTFQRLCGNAITRVEFRNSCYVDAFHSHTREYQVFAIGSEDEPGQGGAGTLPGKPGTGGAGGMLAATVAIDRRLADLRGGDSPSRHPGTPGGAGGTPAVAHKVTFRAWSDGSTHRFTYDISRKTATPGPSSGPGPEPNAPKGADGQLVELASRADTAATAASAWVAPILLNIVLQFVRDLAGAEQTDAAQELLHPYLTALAASDPIAVAALYRTAGVAEDVTGSAENLTQLRAEAVDFSQRLDRHLDAFGNPPGWVPNLALTGLVGAYDAVRDIALKELFSAYYLEKMWRDKQDRSDALKQLIDVMVKKTEQLKAQLIDTRNAIMQRGYVPPSDPTTAQPVSVGRLAGTASAPDAPYDDMSLIEKLRSLILQMEVLDKKRATIENRLRTEADRKTLEQSQWEAVQAGLKISGAVLKALPLPPPYEQAASAFGGLLDVTASFLERGPDDTAFASLKTEVNGFLDDQQDSLTTLFTQGMDAELSAHNESIEALEKAAKEAKAAKDALKQDYEAAGQAEQAARDASIAALTDRRNQRLRQRQPAPNPAQLSPIDFNKQIATRAQELTATREATQQRATEYTAKVAELKTRKEAIKAKSEALQQKIKDTTRAKETREKSTKENIARTRKLVDGVAEIGKIMNKLAVSETQLNTKWNETLARIQLEDAEFQSYVAQLAFLNDQKKAVVGRLVQLLSTLQDLQQQLARNLTAINELRMQYAKSGVDDLDHNTLLYVQGMRQDAHRRLTTFLYYVTRAYEYYTVSPWPSFFADAQKIFEDLRTVLETQTVDVTGILDADDKARADKEKRLRELITAPSGPSLSTDDQALLTNVYEKPLRDMGSRMLELITKGAGRIDEGEQRVVLRDEELLELNARIRAGRSARMTINLARFDHIADSNERQRLAGFRVTRAVGRCVGTRVPSDITFKVTHIGKSIVRSQGRFFAFDPQGAMAGTGEAQATGVTFETNAAPPPEKCDNGMITLANDQLTVPHPKEQENLIGKLLGRSDSIVLSQFRPGVFSDFLLTVEFGPRDATVEFSEIEFVLAVEKGNASTSDALVTVFNDQDLALEITANRPDLSGRQAGIGRYLAVHPLHQLEAEPLVVSVPSRYGEFRHVGWTGPGTPLPPDNGRSACLVSKGGRLIARYERTRT